MRRQLRHGWHSPCDRRRREERHHATTRSARHRALRPFGGPRLRRGEGGAGGRDRQRPVHGHQPARGARPDRPGTSRQADGAPAAAHLPSGLRWNGGLGRHRGKTRGPECPPLPGASCGPGRPGIPARASLDSRPRRGRRGGGSGHALRLSHAGPAHRSAEAPGRARPPRAVPRSRGPACPAGGGRHLLPGAGPLRRGRDDAAAVAPALPRS